MLLLAAFVAVAAPRATAQPDKITVALEVRSEGVATRDQMAARLMDDVRKGLEASPDIEVNPRDRRANRIVWIVAGTAGPPFAAAMMVTERYDRETLMVLGIEDDDMAHRMMALQIAIDHQIFTGRDLAGLGTRIVAALNAGVFARLRTGTKRP